MFNSGASESLNREHQYASHLSQEPDHQQQSYFVKFSKLDWPTFIDSYAAGRWDPRRMPGIPRPTWLLQQPPTPGWEASTTVSPTHDQQLEPQEAEDASVAAQRGGITAEQGLVYSTNVDPEAVKLSSTESGNVSSTSTSDLSLWSTSRSTGTSSSSAPSSTHSAPSTAGSGPYTPHPPGAYPRGHFIAPAQLREKQRHEQQKPTSSPVPAAKPELFSFVPGSTTTTHRRASESAGQGSSFASSRSASHLRLQLPPLPLLSGPITHSLESPASLPLRNSASLPSQHIGTISSQNTSQKAYPTNTLLPSLYNPTSVGTP